MERYLKPLRPNVGKHHDAQLLHKRMEMRHTHMIDLGALASLYVGFKKTESDT